MPKRTDLKTILVIGAGPIVIGQACEFDYSGTQACKALREEGYRVVLINSNPATIMTDPDVADATYIEPITPEFVEKVIALEKPCAILPTVGGQTALNCAMELNAAGILEKYNVELIGAKADVIERAENRQLFKEAVESIGLECPKNAVVQTLDAALEALEHIGLPAIIRPSFTLGGAGGGIATTRDEFIHIVKSGLDASPTNEVLIDESVIGWKEFEMEVVRDKADNCIIICSIENIDPMGVHTGDSITVAPALTLTDKEYQLMRNASLAILRVIGVDTGGSNVQFAVNPLDGRMLVIEMNPRVSRSSALASKATGFPIAKVAAKLSIGYTLDEILNDCTKVTPASFEPTIDYIVTKIPRFAFEKFIDTNKELSSSMKSVGEIMAIGRSFAESLQKGLRSLEAGSTGFKDLGITDVAELKEKLKYRTPDRLILIAQSFRCDIELEEIHNITHYDRWFLEQIKNIIDTEKQLKKHGLVEDRAYLLELKKMGFADARIAEITGKTEKEVREIRYKLNIHPVYKKVDTCAAEFNSVTQYMYSCYEGNIMSPGNCEANISERDKVIILGSGPNRIGQGVEFDYACVHAAYALKEAGYEAIMVNCNPETVSTDYDTSDRLYFEPITLENVLEIVRLEKQKGNLKGVIVQFGGQTPLKIAHALMEEGVDIVGTSVDTIDLAEDRERFNELLKKLNLKKPDSFTCYSYAEAEEKVHSIGYPVLVRPSYVLGGRAMEIIHDDEGLKAYFTANAHFFANGPILVDRFLTNAFEVDVDAICDGEKVYVAGIMQHIQEAGIHSGDSACSLPPYSLSKEIIDEIFETSRKLALELKVIGLMNVQYAVKDGTIYILEVNPRASRTVPFVAKSTGVKVANIAAKVMLGEKLEKFSLDNQFKYETKFNHFAVKEAVFPFARFPGVDVILGPEMKSTGESMGIAKTFVQAFAKSQIASGTGMAYSGSVFLSVKDSDKIFAPSLARELMEIGFEVYSTTGTIKYLMDNGVRGVKLVKKATEGTPNIVDMLKEHKINLVINTTEGKQAIIDSFSIRRTALMNKIPCVTTIFGAIVLVESIKQTKSVSMEVKSLQSYFKEKVEA